MFEQTSRLAKKLAARVSRRGFLDSLGGWAAAAAIGVAGILAGAGTARADAVNRGRPHEIVERLQWLAGEGSSAKGPKPECVKRCDRDLAPKTRSVPTDEADVQVRHPIGLLQEGLFHNCPAQYLQSKLTLMQTGTGHDWRKQLHLDRG